MSRLVDIIFRFVRCYVFHRTGISIVFEKSVTTISFKITFLLLGVFLCGFPLQALNLPLTEPVRGFGLTNAFPGIAFSSPVGLISAPGETNRLFVVEKSGRIMVMNNLEKPVVSTFLDLRNSTWVAVEAGLLGLVFHPNFAANGRFFVYRTLVNQGPRTQLSEFRCSPPSSNYVDPSTEIVIISQLDGTDTHNAGDLKFGPDGYLYLSLGDELPIYPDNHDTPQAIDKGFFGGIIRIDVDLRPENLPPNPHPASTSNYRVPRDNPFVGATQFNGLPVNPNSVRTEFYAVGLRNPWRFCFDPGTHQLVCADVGGGNTEEIDFILPGGNYGWPYMEANLILSQEPLPSGLKLPIFTYQHGYGLYEGNVIIGGLVYRNSELPGLNGKYLFADYSSGNIWALDLYAEFPGAQWLAARTGISSFGRHPANGDVLLVNHLDGTIDRLVYVPPEKSSAPARLSEVGAFTNLASLGASLSMTPFEVISPLWSDGAIKQRWVDFSRALDQITFRPTNLWSYPAGAVWVKHFELELTKGVPESRRRIETRFLVKTDADIYGLTYRWGDSKTEAQLVPPQGMDEPIAIQDGGILRTQIWRYPGSDQCRTCHNALSGYVLGFTASQLNREIKLPSGSTNQLSWFGAHGYFGNSKEIHPEGLLRLADLDDPYAPLQHKVRSYLQSNCVQCHQPGGRSLTGWDARIATPLVDAYLVGANPTYYPAPAKIIDPHHADNSVIPLRVSVRAPLFQMPPIATTVVDERFVNSLTNWINTMPSEDWIATNIGPHFMEGGVEQGPGSVRISSASEGMERNAFEFFGREQSGTTEIVAALSSLKSESPQAEAGLMLRRTFEQESAAAAVLRKNGLFSFCISDGFELTTVSNIAVGDQNWLRLVTDGHSVSASIANDSFNWQALGTASLDLAPFFYAGFMAASGTTDNRFASAEFTNLALRSIELIQPFATNFTLPSDIPLAARVSANPAASVVTFYAGTNVIGAVSADPWTMTWSNAPPGQVEIKAMVHSGSTILTSAPVLVDLVAQPSEVWLFAEDTRTLGNWVSVYGKDSFLIPGVANSSDSMVHITLKTGVPMILGRSEDPSALMNGSERIASQMEANGDLEILLSCDDQAVHWGSLYFFDSQGLGSTQTISFLDPLGSETLAVMDVASKTGVYVPFAFRAPIMIRVHNASGRSYLNGVFVDPVKPLVLYLDDPWDGDTFQQPVSVPISVQASAPGRGISLVEIWDGPNELVALDSPPYHFVVTNIFAGEHQLWAFAKGTFGTSASSIPIKITVSPPETRVSFIGADTNTMGWWKGRYGSDGYWIIGEGFTIPPWLEVLPEDYYYYAFTDDSPLPQALQRASGDGRLAHSLFGSSFSMKVQPLDGGHARVGFYVVDFSQSHRAMDIQAEDMKGTVLDRREVIDFDFGRYLFWDIVGAVRFRFVSKAINAVVSAVFVDQNLASADLLRNNAFPPLGTPGNSGDYLADYDGDGFSDGLEYFLGFDPVNASDKPTIFSTVNDGNLSIVFTHRAFPPEVHLEFERSNDLLSWESATPVSIQLRNSGNKSLIRFEFPVDDSSCQFIRIIPAPNYPE